MKDNQKHSKRVEHKATSKDVRRKLLQKQFYDVQFNTNFYFYFMQIVNSFDNQHFDENRLNRKDLYRRLVDNLWNEAIKNQSKWFNSILQI